ncbi:DUF2993 domain-containing protein [Streptomyces acidiscabies]|uniref:DUF2993 domain-containing protein n=1 Tax=Streptomyces acidiscabies TaxID=42234 RepID=A0AAP6ELB4_9ACTN|nr:DUF2993 domain-containing protein [Streptomyces acidiscabies]MBP5942157.1 DUF2993 domain-containing protein [Streptomyces sp. LBUM 1476]MBZ3913670.1 DUF2993 domain-containing protein [Streptomyces acidiscabies]MDX2966485.1 DUF2993 domain-containing protein [Streptomyces acidiscabies]MDX3026036.1 DUF2993 domain-containing protein [Streptomyces acidiscabies]MDX3796438.1 DUF2993 domain-containing protein [Streptomyces acidiscabies]
MSESPYRYDDGTYFDPYHPSYDPYGHGDVTDAAPAPRRSRRPLAVAAALLALVLLPVAVDRAVAARIESRTAKAFQEGMDTPLPPQVHVRGFPVLTQAASGILNHVDITARDIPADGDTRPLPVSELSLRLEGLTKSDDDSEARARNAEATAFLSYRDLSNALGLEISQGSRPGQVSAVVLLPFGRQATVTTSVAALSGNRIAFRDFAVTGGVVPGDGGRLLGKLFAQPIQLRNIPDGLRLRSVTSTDGGLTVRFSGSSVTFRPDDGASSSVIVSGNA